MDKQMLYKYRDYYSYDKPRGTRVVGREYVKEVGDEVYLCKRKFYIRHLILILLCLAVCYVYINSKQEHCDMTYRDVIYVRDNLIEIGLKNSDSNTCNAQLNLVYGDIPLINTIDVDIGEYVASVPIRQTLEPGSYTAKLYYTVILDFWHITKEYNVLVIVE